MSVCRWCGKQIKWMRTDGGKYTACDPEPQYFFMNAEGDLRGESFIKKKGPDYGTELRGQRLKSIEIGAELGYRLHWRTCAEPGRFRKRW